MKRLAMVAATVLALVVLATGCEPAMTITAKNQNGAQQTCDTQMVILGTVNPATATAKVTLQHYVSGKWSDVKGYYSFSQAQAGGAPTSRTGSVNQSSGAYKIGDLYMPENGYGEFHMRMRVRSSGGGSVSPSVYVSAVTGEGFC